jgi:hypothetical protein
VGIYYNDSLTITTGGGGGGGGSGRGAPPRYLRIAGLVNMGISAWVDRFLGGRAARCQDALRWWPAP